MPDIARSTSGVPWRPMLLVNKIGLLLVGALALALFGAGNWTTTGIAAGLYLAFSLLFLILLETRPNKTVSYALNYVLDLSFTAYLIYATGGGASNLWPLLVLEALTPAFYLSRPLLIWLGAFSVGPLYTLVLWLSSGNLAFLTNPIFLTRYIVLFLAAVLGALIADRLQATRQRQNELQEMLAKREADLDAQAMRLQRTAEDLGDRVLQLRSLQEVARALAATLDLPDTLQALVDRLAVMADARHAAIALLDVDETVLRGVAASGPSADAIHRFSLDLSRDNASDILLRQGHIIVSDNPELMGFRWLHHVWQVEDFLCLPLLLRGQPLGAIYLADARPDLDSERQRQLLDSFSYFAAAAIENARLYQAVAEKSRELETILAGIGDGVLVVDDDLRLVLMNPVAARIFALESSPPAGVPVHLLIDHEGFFSLLGEVQQPPYRVHMREIELTTPIGGKQAVYQALAAPLLAGENLQGIATVLRDVTGQKELERMKSNFLSVVSHELKTPLHSMKGFVDIILMGKTGPVSEIQRDFLETVKQQNDHLQRMIDDLLEFSRLESGRVTLRLQPVDLPVVVEAVIDKLSPLAESVEVTLVNRAPETLPTFQGDPWRLEQVVTNLVDNAIKFTPAGGAVTISAHESDTHLQVSVHDTGIGVPRDQLERIFDRFYQVDGGANRLYKGTGLGLTICRHIVEHHGGRIWAESEPGHGAAFVFTLSKICSLPNSNRWIS